MGRAKSKIEELAVIYFNLEIAKFDCLQGDLSTMDKRPVWDGHIFVYKNGSHKVADLLGRIPVQIKGTEVKSYSDDTCKHRVDQSFLRSCASEFGLLYVVVEIKGNDFKLFCESLLPYDIQKYLQDMNSCSNDTTNITVRQLKNDHISNLYLQCRRFLTDRKKQAGERTIPIEGLRGVQGYEFTTICGSSNNFLDAFIENPTYLYAKTENNVLFPVEKIDNVAMAVMKLDCPVMTGNILFYDSYSVISHGKGNKYIQIGTSLKLFFDDCKLNYTEKGTVQERIHAINFVISVLKNDGMTIDQKFFPINIDLSEKTNFMSMLKKRLNVLEDIISLFSFLGLATGFDIDDFSHEDSKIISQLIDHIIKGNRDAIILKREGAHIIQICNYKAAIFYLNGEIKNYFSRNFFMTVRTCYTTDDGSEIEISPYHNLAFDHISQLSNFNADVVMESIEKCNHEGNDVNMYNQLLLESIKAYDQNSNNHEPVKLMDILSSYIVSKNDDIIFRLNRLQVIQRLRAFSDDDYTLLAEMKKTTNDIEMLCGIHILLAEREDFEKLFSQLDGEKQRCFKSYPIYFLYTKL